MNIWVPFLFTLLIHLQIRERFKRKASIVFPSAANGNSTRKNSNVNLSDLRPFLTSKQFGEPQNTGTKIYLPNRHSSSPRYQRALSIQLIYSWFLVTILPPIAKLHLLHINPHTTHNSSNRSDEGLKLETSVFLLITMVTLRFQLSC